MKSILLWVDDDGKVRHPGPFANEERILTVFVDHNDTIDDIKQMILEEYEARKINHPLRSKYAQQTT